MAVSSHGTRDQVQEYRDQMQSELNALKGQLGTAETKGHTERAENLRTGIKSRQTAIDFCDDELKVHDMLDSGTAGYESGSEPGATDGRKAYGNTVADQAKRVLDAAFKGAKLPDHAAEKAASLLAQGTTGDQTLAARWVVAAGDPHYDAAFAKLLVDPARGHLQWSAREQAAYQAAKSIQGELKAGTLTGNSELLPLALDPTIRLTSAGSINPLRRISNVVTTISNTWQGVTSAGVTAEWKAEGTQMTDASPGTDPASIPVHLGDAWVPYSYEVGQDAAPAGFSNAIAGLLTDAAEQLQATAYTTGSGSGQPTGIITALTGTASEINAAADDVFASGDVFALQNALPARFSEGAQWCAHIAIINRMALMETTAGMKMFAELGEGRLLNRPINELSNMDGVINTTGAVSNFVLLYGDFARGFTIVDRVGTSVEMVQNVVGVDGRPTGQRGVVMWFRTGSDSVVDNAFRMLDVASAA